MKRRRTWLIRTATEADRLLLRRFHCADPAIEWEREVEQFIQAQLLDWALAPLASEDDPRVLLLFEVEGGALVGVAAHERVQLKAPGNSEFSATRLQVAALARSWQGRRFDDGSRASDVLLSAVMTDVSKRAPPRAARVLAIIHERNARSLAVCARHGLTEEMSRPSPSYRRLITAHRS